MDHDLGELTAGDGTRLVYHRWRVDSAVGTVGLLPGLAGHAGQPGYAFLVDALTQEGLAVYGLDLRGRGRSGGIRDHVDSWGDYFEDVDRFLRTVVEQETPRPVFLFGQSMGGLLALDYGTRPGVDLAGVVACCPALALQPAPPEQVAQLEELDRSAPTTLLPSPVQDMSVVTRDPTVQQALQQDPLVLREVTVRAETEMVRAIGRVQQQAPAFTLPLLLVYGTDDPLVPPSGSREFFEHAGSPDKTLLPCEGSRHQPFADLDRDRVNTDIANWITNRCPR